MRPFPAEFLSPHSFVFVLSSTLTPTHLHHRQRKQPSELLLPTWQRMRRHGMNSFCGQASTVCVCCVGVGVGPDPGPGPGHRSVGCAKVTALSAPCAKAGNNGAERVLLTDGLSLGSQNSGSAAGQVPPHPPPSPPPLLSREGLLPHFFFSF